MLPHVSEKVVSGPPLRLSKRSSRTAAQPISYLMHAAVSNPDIISFAAGLVDPQTMPVSETLNSVTDLLADSAAARQALQYGTTQGYLRLRELAIEHLERLEGRTTSPMDPGNVVITTGSQQLLQLVSDVLLDPGDIVIMGSPDYFVYMGVLAGIGARAVGVAMDEHGIVPEALKETMARLDQSQQLSHVKLVYCTSYYQNPTGVSLAADRRSAILEIVHQWSTAGRIFLLEDCAYRELYYDKLVAPSIRSFDEAGRTVILAQTFSKSFAPGLKTGYSVLPSDLVAPVLCQKGNHDFGSANFNQHLLAVIMEKGWYWEHLHQLRHNYGLKLAAMLGALESEMRMGGVDAHWTRPTGGLYIWLALPKSVDTTQSGRLFHRCLENGVLYVPGEHCFPATYDESGTLGGPSHTMRLSFGVPSVPQIEEGIRRLAAAVSECRGEMH